MDTMITLESLAEFPVLVVIVGIITQLTKRAMDKVLLKLFNIISMPTEIMSFIISLLLLLAVSYGKGSFINITTNELFTVIFIDFLNALIVSMAANKGYEQLTSEENIISKIKRKKE